MSLRPEEWNLTTRELLQARVVSALSRDGRVERVDVHGSLAAGTSDVLSDIDLIACLRPGMTDRAYFLELPNVMDSVGPRLIDGMSFAALPAYACTFYFEGVPLLWHVDIGVIPTDPAWHVDAADLLTVKRWEQRFKMWIEAVKRFLRAEHQPSDGGARMAFDTYLAEIRMRMAKRMDMPPLTGTSRGQLSMLLDMEIAWHQERGIGSARVFEACDALRRDVLT